MPELRSGVRRGRASRNPTANNDNEEIDGRKVTPARTRGRRGGAAGGRGTNAGNRGRGRGRGRGANRKQPVAAAEAAAAAVVGASGGVEGDAKAADGVKASSQKSSSKAKENAVERGELGLGLGGGGGVREEVGEREMDDYDSGGNAVGRSGDKGLDDDLSAPLPEKVCTFISLIVVIPVSSTYHAMFEFFVFALQLCVNLKCLEFEGKF